MAIVILATCLVIFSCLKNWSVLQAATAGCMCLEKPCFTVCKWGHRQNINKRLQNILWHDRLCVKRSMYQSTTVPRTAKTDNSTTKSLMDDPSRVLTPFLSLEHLCKIPQDDVIFWIQEMGPVLTRQSSVSDWLFQNWSCKFQVPVDKILWHYR